MRSKSTIYSDHTKAEVITAVLNGMSRTEAEKTFNVSKSTLQGWVNKRVKTKIKVTPESKQAAEQSVNTRIIYPKTRIQFLQAENEFLRSQVLSMCN